MADSGQRLHQRDQRRNSGEITGGVALPGVCCGVDHVEICAAGQRSAHLESIEFWYLSVGVSCARNGGDTQHSVGKLFAADGGDLGSGFGDYYASPPI